MVCNGEQPAGTQNRSTQCLTQRLFEDFTKVEQSNIAEEFGACETKKGASQYSTVLQPAVNTVMHTKLYRNIYYLHSTCTDSLMLCTHTPPHNKLQILKRVYTLLPTQKPNWKKKTSGREGGEGRGRREILKYLKSARQLLLKSCTLVWKYTKTHWQSYKSLQTNLKSKELTTIMLQCYSILKM